MSYAPGTLSWWQQVADAAAPSAAHDRAQPPADHVWDPHPTQQQMHAWGLPQQETASDHMQLSCGLHGKLCVSHGTTFQQTVQPAVLSAPAPALSPQLDMAAMADPRGRMHLHADDLCVLALLLTAAKVLFCAGALDVSLLLLQLMEPVEQAAAAAQPLHLSSIRNEAAYAALIRKLLQQVPPPPLHTTGADTRPDAGSLEVLYVCGDSHVIPCEAGTKCRMCRATAQQQQPIFCACCDCRHRSQCGCVLQIAWSSRALVLPGFVD